MKKLEEKGGNMTYSDMLHHFEWARNQSREAWTATRNGLVSQLGVVSTELVLGQEVISLTATGRLALKKVALEMSDDKAHQLQAAILTAIINGRLTMAAITEELTRAVESFKKANADRRKRALEAAITALKSLLPMIAWEGETIRVGQA